MEILFALFGGLAMFLYGMDRMSRAKLLQHIFGLLFDSRVDAEIERHRFFHSYHLSFIVTHFTSFCNGTY